MKSISAFWFATRMAAFIVSIAGDREITSEDLHASIDNLKPVLDSDGNGIVIGVQDHDSFRKIHMFAKELERIMEDGKISVDELHLVIDRVAEEYANSTGKALTFKF